MHAPQESMPAVLDRQIGREQDDAFGHRHFAQALRSLVESDHHQPPFSIGLLGGWGTGKSSIKELYTRGLEDDASPQTGGTPRKNRFTSITFNAWRFGGKDQDIKRALLRHVFLELGGDEQALHDRLFRNVTHIEQQWKGWKDYTLQLWRAWAMPLPAFLIAMGLLLFFIWAGLKILPSDSAFSQSTLALIISGAYSYLLKQLKPSKIDSFRSITKVSLPSASAEQYEEMLLEQLKYFKHPTKGMLSKAIPCERLVIFVDDLDRLSAEEMVLGLDAVRAFMEIPAEKLPQGLGLVFVISCDEAKVADALWKGRSHNPEHPGTVFSHSDARRYLDRIFQFRLEIPPAPRNDMRQFALKHLSTFEEIVNDLNARGNTPEQMIERMIHVNVVDPRNALQIVNAFAQSWWLAKRRELEGNSSERPGGLHVGAVTGHPISLAALSAAKVSFPDFYRDLQDDPELLNRLTSVLVHDVSVLELPTDIRPLLLKRYVTLEDDGVGGKSTKIREGCRELRQFLSSLVGIRWPDSLQSLLLLSEDPISRKFGAGTSVIYGLLMSGDTKGVIEHLSPRADKVVLNEDQGRLLHQMVSDLHLEPENRRHNAMRVVANLLNDLPGRTVRLVLGPLCTELAASSSLRSMVGVKKIGSALAIANKQEQRNVAAALVEDLCTINRPFGLSLENMQTPSLDAAKVMAQDIAEIIMNIREEHGLPVTQDGMFVKWLHDRTISVSDVSYSFPFSSLERWVAIHENMLVKALGTDYITLLAIEVEAGRGQDIDLPQAATRVHSLFEELALAGEESRAELWELVEGYLSLPGDDLKACAFTILEQHHSLMGAQPLSHCITKVADLLINYPAQQVDYERGSKWLLQVAARHIDSLTETATNSLVALVDNLAVDGYEQDAVSLYESAILRKDELTARVAGEWVASLADGLPLKCCEALFRSYARLPQTVKAAIAAYLDSGYTTASLPERYTELYSLAATDIPASCWKETELQAHLNTAWSRLPSMLSRAVADVSSVLQGLSKVYLGAEPSIITSGLENTFTTANSYPAQLNTLHRFFAETWPPNDSVELGTVPQKIFNDAISVMSSYPQEAKKDVLKSLQRLIDSGIVDPSQQPELAVLGCAVWQTHSDEAESFLAQTNASLTASQVATLVDAIHWELTEEVERLKRVWNNVADNLSLEEQQAVTALVLAKGQLGGTDLPDQCLTLWTQSLGKGAYEVLKQSILDKGARDDGQRRLWRQITSLIEKPEAMELIELAMQLLELPSAPETSTAVIAELKVITQRFADQAERFKVANLLLKRLPRIPSMASKASLAVLAHDLGSPAVLKSVEASALSDDDLQVIAEKFGDVREMKNLRKRFEKVSG